MSINKRLVLRLSYAGLTLLATIGITAFVALRTPQAPDHGSAPYVGQKALPADLSPAVNGEQRYATTANKNLHDTLQRFVDKDGFVDYHGLSENRHDLDLYLHTVAYLDPQTFERWGRERKMAFWINVYNACTLQIVSAYHPIGSSLYGYAQNLLGHPIPANSIRNLPFVWERCQFHVMGKPLTLNQIEHHILRPQFKDARIHMAINCASVGCPPLLNFIYTERQLTEQLEAQTRAFLLQHPASKVRIDRDKNEVALSAILHWFAADFIAQNPASPDTYPSGQTAEERAVLVFISRYLAQTDADYLRTANYSIHYSDYDWSLNQQP